MALHRRCQERTPAVCGQVPQVVVEAAQRSYRFAVVKLRLSCNSLAPLPTPLVIWSFQVAQLRSANLAKQFP